MKFSKSLLAVSMSAMMLFSAPVANAGILQCQTVEAAVSKTSKLNKTTANLTLGKGVQLSLSNAVSSKDHVEGILSYYPGCYSKRICHWLKSWFCLCVCYVQRQNIQMQSNGQSGSVKGFLKQEINYNERGRFV